MPRFCRVGPWIRLAQDPDHLLHTESTKTPVAAPFFLVRFATDRPASFMLASASMGLFARWRQERLEEYRRNVAPLIEARKEIWAREAERLGEDEFNKRFQAVTDYRLGLTGPSGYEDWHDQFHAHIKQRAHELAMKHDTAS
jgi:hypothetical protein